MHARVVCRTTIHRREKKRERKEDKKGTKGNMKERNVMKLHFV